jgi:uncharacterized protein YegJ (DUF2314 family)
VSNEDSTPLAGVTISPSTGSSATTASDGSYTLTGLAEGSYTITPEMNGYTFDPPSQTVSVPPDATNIEFTAIPESVQPDTYTITGAVTDNTGNPLANVNVSTGTGSTVTTASDGSYTLTGLAEGSYTITPEMNGYTFDPPSQTVSVPPDATNIEFTAIESMNQLTISGRVTSTDGNGLAGVSVTTDGGQTTTTDSDGSYTLTGLAEGSYTITPEMSGYTFDPPSQTITLPDETDGPNFIATPIGSRMTMSLAVSALITVKITDESGTVMANERVDVSSDYGTVVPANTMTDEQGEATFIVAAADNPGTATVTVVANGMRESLVVQFGEITDNPTLYLPFIKR